MEICWWSLLIFDYHIHNKSVPWIIAKKEENGLFILSYCHLVIHVITSLQGHALPTNISLKFSLTFLNSLNTHHIKKSDLSSNCLYQPTISTYPSAVQQDWLTQWQLSSKTPNHSVANDKENWSKQIKFIKLSIVQKWFYQKPT